jgi:predicted RNA-binding protein with PUA-like domain
MAEHAHWLIKSEPASYSIDDLARDGQTSWDGVRNFQARNFMRDQMKAGDPVLFYHSSADPTGVAGIAKVVRAARPDLTALDPKDHHHDPRATREEPIWVAVEIGMVEKFPGVVTLATLKATPALKGMAVLQRGQRLSVQPVSAEHFEIVKGLGRKKSRQ